MIHLVDGGTPEGDAIQGDALNGTTFHGSAALSPCTRCSQCGAVCNERMTKMKGSGSLHERILQSGKLDNGEIVKGLIGHSCMTS
jgi:hypothetical protein